MKIHAILNRDGGTFKTADLEDYRRHLEDRFEAAGRRLTVEICRGREIVERLEAAAEGADAFLAGGGDGTISAAAAVARASGKPLGVLPAGTMNLFSRSLGLPLDIHDAAAVLARARPSRCDIGTANGRPFIHQFSVGLHPRVVRERDRVEHRSRLEKILGGLKAAFGALSRPPSFQVRLSRDSGAPRSMRVSLLAVSNNPYGEGHLPYADRLDRGVLGVYHAHVLDMRANLRLAADLTLGSWSGNPDFVGGVAKRVRIEFPKLKKNAKGLIDGEICALDKSVDVRIEPGALPVLAPETDEAGAPLR